MNNQIPKETRDLLDFLADFAIEKVINDKKQNSKTTPYESKEPKGIQSRVQGRRKSIAKKQAIA